MPPKRPPAWLAWSAPVLFLGAVMVGTWVVLARPPALLGIPCGALLLVPVGWVLVSALWPARAERRCPCCAADALERLDARTTHGLRCPACGWQDESASGWLLAEEEGPLEEIVLAQRGRGPARLVEPGSGD